MCVRCLPIGNIAGAGRMNLSWDGLCLGQVWCRREFVDVYDVCGSNGSDGLGGAGTCNHSLVVVGGGCV